MRLLTILWQETTQRWKRAIIHHVQQMKLKFFDAFAHLHSMLVDGGSLIFLFFVHAIASTIHNPQSTSTQIANTLFWTFESQTKMDFNYMSFH